jgi:hypothetical protein
MTLAGSHGITGTTPEIDMRKMEDTQVLCVRRLQPDRPHGA